MTTGPANVSEGGIVGDDVLASAQAGRRYLRGGSVRVGGYVSGVAVGLGATPFVVRHLGPANWGGFITVTSLLFIVAAITEGGLANLGVREFSTADDADRRRFMRDLLGLRITLTLAGAIAAIGFAALAGYGATLIAGTAIACVGLLAANLQFTFAVPLTAGLRLEWVAAIDFLTQLTTAAMMVALVLLGAGLLPFFAINPIAATAALMLTVRLVHRQLSLRPAFNLRRWRALMADSLVYAAATALGVVYFRIVVIAMSLLAGKLETGYFSLSFRILDIVNGIPWLLVTSSFPILARAAQTDAQRLRYALQRLFDGGLIAGGWFSLCVVTAAPFAVQVIGGSKFHAAVPVLRILGAGIVATFLVATWSFALLSLKMYRQLMLVNAAIVVLAIALSAILIPTNGATGAAGVTLALEVLLAAGYAAVLMARFPDLRPSLRLVPRIGAALGIAFAAATLLPVHPALATLIGSIVLAGGLLAVDAVPDELVELVARRRE